MHAISYQNNYVRISSYPSRQEGHLLKQHQLPTEKHCTADHILAYTECMLVDSQLRTVFKTKRKLQQNMARKIPKCCIIHYRSKQTSRSGSNAVSSFRKPQAAEIYRLFETQHSVARDRRSLRERMFSSTQERYCECRRNIYRETAGGPKSISRYCSQAVYPWTTELRLIRPTRICFAFRGKPASSL